MIFKTDSQISNSMDFFIEFCVHFFSTEFIGKKWKYIFIYPMDLEVKGYLYYEI